MEILLHAEYGINVHHVVEIDGKQGYDDGEHIYFIIPVQDKKVKDEQITLSVFLYNQGYYHCTCPILNKSGHLFTEYQQTPYMVIKINQFQRENTVGSGQVLAQFHQIGAQYSFEPQVISSYGKWGNHWIDKLTAFERKLLNDAQEHPNPYNQLIMDCLPYFIGISENAIQYFQESLYEKRYDFVDQGSITFHRYHDNLKQQVVWLSDLMYDHPVRDIAEYIRVKLLEAPNLDSILLFLQDYESVRPLSVFSWRLLYARLLYPIHFYDFFAKKLSETNSNERHKQLENLLESQEKYERRLKQLFHMKTEDYNIPMVHWL